MSSLNINIESIPKVRTVLNIQSHVVHGYVGNKASTFPLQMLNWEVDVMNTVNFSNHTGYGSFRGSCATGQELLELYDGLRESGFQYDAVLTGYVSGHETLVAVGKICTDSKLKAMDEGKNITWLLDPVMGDEGQLYVEENVIPVYRRLLESKLVDIVTPNQYELELLLDKEISSIENLKTSLSLFHDRFNVKHVVLSSLFADKFDDLEGGSDTIYCCVSSTLCEKLVFFKIEKIDSYFTGVGDLFSSLLLDRITSMDDVAEAVNESLTVMKKVLFVTKNMTTTKGVIGDKHMKDCELRVVECKNFYEQHDKFYEPILISKK